MKELRVSIITVCRNAESTIARCLESVAAQHYGNIQQIVIDGNSSDRTLDIIGKYAGNIDVLVSEPDHGIYDAMNKGISLASGDIIGMLNADDVFADENVVGSIAGVFADNTVDVLYADLNYLKQNSAILRKWRPGNYRHGLFDKGWMPPHPTFYCRKALFGKFGTYSLHFGTAADYELMLRFIHTGQARVRYLEKVVVHMYTGGISNQSYRGRFKVMRMDMRAMHQNGIKYPLVALLLKKISKFRQFF